MTERQLEDFCNAFTEQNTEKIERLLATICGIQSAYVILPLQRRRKRIFIMVFYWDFLDIKQIGS